MYIQTPTHVSVPFTPTPGEAVRFCWGFGRHDRHLGSFSRIDKKPYEIFGRWIFHCRECSHEVNPVIFTASGSGTRIAWLRRTPEGQLTFDEPVDEPVDKPEDESSELVIEITTEEPVFKISTYESIGGWVSQIKVQIGDSMVIVWESEPDAGEDGRDVVEKAAHDHATTVLRDVFNG